MPSNADEFEFMGACLSILHLSGAYARIQAMVELQAKGGCGAAPIGALARVGERSFGSATPLMWNHW